MLLEYFGKSKSSLICSLLADFVLITRPQEPLEYLVLPRVKERINGFVYAALQKAQQTTTIKTIRLKVMCVTDSIEEKG